MQRSLLVPPAALCLLEVYSRAPPLAPPTEAPPPLLPPGAAPAPRDLVVVLPGSGGPDANTARIAATLRAAGGREVVEYDWRRWKGDELRAPYDALRLGTRLGTELGRRTDQPRSVHLVGVSVGAFVADAIAKSYATTAGSGLCGNQGGSDLGQLLWRPLSALGHASGCLELRPASANQPLGLRMAGHIGLGFHIGAGRANVHLTLCDAFTARGLAGLARPTTAYGVANFGSSADYCESILNTDDPVPHTRVWAKCRPCQ